MWPTRRAVSVQRRGGIAAAPVSAQQPEAKVRLAGDFRLIGPVRRLQGPFV
jgi:hypothetical protein